MSTESDSVNTGALATVVIVGSLMVVAVSLAVTAFVRSEQDAADERNGTTANLRPVRDLKNEQRVLLAAEPSWIDRPHGVVAIPLDRAMATVVSEIQDNPLSATPPQPRTSLSGAAGVAGAAGAVGEQAGGGGGGAGTGGAGGTGGGAGTSGTGSIPEPTKGAAGAGPIPSSGALN